jgi:hypothetical protein
VVPQELRDVGLSDDDVLGTQLSALLTVGRPVA